MALPSEHPEEDRCPTCGEPQTQRALFCPHCGDRLPSPEEARWRRSDPGAPGGDLTGETILEYVLDRKVGEGGMGSVYIAHHQALGQRVAVKILHPELARDPALVERFVQEARIQIRLRHPGVVSVYTAVTTGPHIAMVMEYVDGVSLAEVLERRGTLPWEDARTLMRQVLDVVGYAHSQGVIHRDLKPANVMITADGTARVMDFGIARVVAADRKTRTGTAMGSADYMAPEQILGRSDLDHRADIYALGVTLFEILTGRLPFGEHGDGGTSSDFLVRQAHVQTPAPDPRTVMPDIEPAVAAAILRALEKDPAQRFERCEEMAEALGLKGAKGSAAVSPAAEARGAPAPEAAVSPAVYAAGEGSLASRGARFIAFFLDDLLFSFAAFLLGLLAFRLLEELGLWNVATLAQAAVVCLIPQLLDHRAQQRKGTPGKRMTSMVVMQADGSPLTPSVSWRRTWVKWLPNWLYLLAMAAVHSGFQEEVAMGWVGLLTGLYLIASFLSMFFAAQRRSFHDLAAGTVVVKRPSTVTPQPGDLR